ncbi:serine/threonine protein phosphatase family protein [Streptococcus pneumoniae]|nr:serine/threonine protein phosphatase family protein [Streptococcus pneumoniae]
MTKIALLSDIHGNTTALEAVLADARQLGVDEYWLLGDILMPGTGRRRILDLLDQLPITARVLGNWEDSLWLVSVRNWIVLAPVNAISCASASMF